MSVLEEGVMKSAVDVVLASELDEARIVGLQ